MAAAATTVLAEDALRANASWLSASPRNRRVMAWMGTTLRTDVEINASIAYFASHRDVINTVSPETHSLGDNGTLVERLLAPGATHTPTSIIRALKAAGLMVIPQIYDERAWNKTAILPRFEQLASDPTQFIADAVALAVSEGLDGWNIDFELTDDDWANISRVTADGELFVAFVDRFARALHVKGKVLSVDIGTDSNPRCVTVNGRPPTLKDGCFAAWWHTAALNSTDVDTFVDMSSYLDFKDYVIAVSAMLSSFADVKNGMFEPGYVQTVSLFGCALPLLACGLPGVVMLLCSNMRRVRLLCVHRHSPPAMSTTRQHSGFPMTTSMQ